MLSEFFRSVADTLDEITRRVARMERHCHTDYQECLSVGCYRDGEPIWDWIQDPRLAPRHLVCNTLPPVKFIDQRAYWEPEA